VNAFIYVEGPSDKLAMEALFEDLIARKNSEDVNIEFFPATRGDRKKYLLIELPRKAVNIILNEAHSIVAVVPDLYPKNKGFPHDRADEMIEGVIDQFKRALRAKGLAPEDRWLRRFKVFCFKHDMEALLLAAEEVLKAHLGTGRLKEKWTIPVEDQDHGNPPKRVIERLFQLHGQSYAGTVHAPSILRKGSVDIISQRCPQCFKPFADFLQRVA
jgi:hypothetical protein